MLRILFLLASIVSTHASTSANNNKNNNEHKNNKNNINNGREQGTTPKRLPNTLKTLPKTATKTVIGTRPFGWVDAETDLPTRKNAGNLSSLYRGDWSRNMDKSKRRKGGKNPDSEKLTKTAGSMVFRLDDYNTTIKDLKYLEGQIMLRNGELTDDSVIRFQVQGLHFTTTGSVFLFSNHNFSTVEWVIAHELRQMKRDQLKGYVDATVQAVLDEKNKKKKAKHEKATSSFGVDSSDDGDDDDHNDHVGRTSPWSSCDFLAVFHIHDITDIAHPTTYKLDADTHVSRHPVSKEWDETYRLSHTLFGKLGVEGTLLSEGCGLDARAAAGRLDQDALTRKGTNYASVVILLTLIKLMMTARQLKSITENSGRCTQMSVTSLGLQSVLDAHLCLLHLSIAIMVDSIFTIINVVMTLEFMCFAFYEMRLLLLLWKARHPIAFNSGWERTRQELSSLYAKYYATVFGGLLLVYILRHHMSVFVFLEYSFWIPQIIHSTRIHTQIKALDWQYVVYPTIARVFIPLYFFGCPDNFLSMGDQPYPAVLLALFVSAQCGVLLGQAKWRGSWFIPDRYLPQRYNYYRPSPLQRVVGSDDADADDEDLCVICLLEMNIEEQGALMVTPCNHVFHSSCLLEWMDQKMDCPTCRFSPLPET